MTKEELIAIAGQLKQPSENSQKEFEEKLDIILSGVNKKMLSRPDLILLIGENNEAMMLDNHRNQLRFMNSVFMCFNPEILLETVLWVFRAYPNHGFNLTYWPAMLNVVLDEIEKELSNDAFNQLKPFYTWLLIYQPFFTKLAKQ